MRWSAFFFFQAEDGIRDLTVTGVQTCALPIFLDWYTMLVGLAAFFALAHHGALWLLVKTAGAVQERARRIARVVWWGVAALTAVVTWFTFRVQPQVPANLSGHRWGYVFPLLALSGLLAVRWFLGRQSAAQNTAQTVAKNERKARSEERRVGKECRSRWSPYH